MNDFCTTCGRKKIPLFSSFACPVGNCQPPSSPYKNIGIVNGLVMLRSSVSLPPPDGWLYAAWSQGDYDDDKVVKLAVDNWNIILRTCSRAEIEIDASASQKAGASPSSSKPRKSDLLTGQVGPGYSSVYFVPQIKVK